MPVEAIIILINCRQSKRKRKTERHLELTCCESVLHHPLSVALAGFFPPSCCLLVIISMHLTHFISLNALNPSTTEHQFVKHTLFEDAYQLILGDWHCQRQACWWELKKNKQNQARHVGEETVWEHKCGDWDTSTPKFLSYNSQKNNNLPYWFQSTHFHFYCKEELQARKDY